MSSQAFKKMQTDKIDAGEGIEAADIANLMCDHSYFDQFKPFVRHSCVKILEEFRMPFLKAFEGRSSAELVMAKGALYDRVRQVCTVDVKACHSSYFSPANDEAPEDADEKAIQCAACRLLSADAEHAYRSAAKSPQTAIEGMCPHVGYAHKPYVWLEDFCAEMVDDHAG